ncbi:MAG: hypothetical protein VX642_06450 [Bdellovibrionota bacterium]|nr:hypothetical protein [Bdellovibrionota bacterium]
MFTIIYSFQSFAQEKCNSEENAAEAIGLVYDLADKHDCSLSMDQTSCAGLAASLGFATTGMAIGANKLGPLFQKSLLTRAIKKEVKEAEKGFKDRVENGFRRENSIREYRLRQNAYNQARNRWYKQNLGTLMDPKKRATLKKQLIEKANAEKATYVKANVPLEFATEQLKAIQEYEEKGLYKEKGLVKAGRNAGYTSYDRSISYHVPPEELSVSRRTKAQERSKIKRRIAQILDEQLQDLKDSKAYEKVYRNPKAILERIRFNAKDFGSRGKKYLDLMYNLGVDRGMMDSINRAAISGSERVKTMKIRLNKVKGPPKLSLKSIGVGTGVLGAVVSLASVPQTACSETNDIYKTLDSSCREGYSYSENIINYFNQPLDVLERANCSGMIYYLRDFFQAEYSPPKTQNSNCKGANVFQTELVGTALNSKMKVETNPETGLAQKVVYKTDIYEYDSEGSLQKICYIREQGKFGHMQVCRQRAEFSEMNDPVSFKAKERARKMSFHAPIMARCCQTSGELPAECSDHYGFAGQSRASAKQSESVR